MRPVGCGEKEWWPSIPACGDVQPPSCAAQAGAATTPAPELLRSERPDGAWHDKGCDAPGGNVGGDGTGGLVAPRLLKDTELVSEALDKTV
mmetsp:Transcript_105400/g.274338  ORF Transcript_105400/g.274338 Transcript_105400/m.274338 type:complete len:91 (+) Transcript_105400:218-490(+)